MANEDVNVTVNGGFGCFSFILLVVTAFASCSIHSDVDRVENKIDILQKKCKIEKQVDK